MYQNICSTSGFEVPKSSMLNSAGAFSLLLPVKTNSDKGTSESRTRAQLTTSSPRQRDARPCTHPPVRPHCFKHARSQVRPANLNYKETEKGVLPSLDFPSIVKFSSSCLRLEQATFLILVYSQGSYFLLAGPAVKILLKNFYCRWIFT